MRSPALAIAWEFRQRHLWGLIALGAYLAILAIIKLLVVASGLPVRFDSAESFAVVVVVPLAATFTYFLAVFTFGFTGDLAARQSMYPARMFTLPVTTAALAAWPMLYGAIAMVILWTAMRLFAVWPSDVDVPVIWPALLATALLAWTQALTWMTYPLPGLRIIVTVFWLGTIDAIALLALHFKAGEPVMLAIVAPQIPLAYLVARFAVARARRGDVPDWQRLFARSARAGVPSRGDRFASPERAQAWFEWRRSGWALPAWVGILLPFELALLWVADSATLVFTIVLGVLVTPPFMAAFAAATVRTSSPGARDPYGVTPFLATRPLTSPALIAAKLKMTMWSTLAAWLLVLVAIPLALKLSDTWLLAMDRMGKLAESIGTPRVIALVVLTVSGLISSTWKQLVQSLYIGLTGRERLIKGSVFLTLAVISLIGPVLDWISEHRSVEGDLWDALPMALAILVCAKMFAAAWVATRLYQSRLLRDRTLVAGAACWCAAVLVLYAVLAWFVDTPHVAHYFLMLLAILAVPLARLSAAPLALAWNRHR